MGKLLELAAGGHDLLKAQLEHMSIIDPTAKLRDAIARRDRSIERLKEIVAQREARINSLIESRARAVASLSGECLPGTSISAKYKNYLKAFGATVPVVEMAANATAALVALRHDVDYSIDVALEMAGIEHALGTRATYYVLHTAPYWDDPNLVEKCLRIQDMGHEIGLHTNVISEWVTGKVDSIEDRLSQLLDTLREGGVTVTGMAAHGDRLCYDIGFINYWCFSELRPDDPAAHEDGLTAEGLRDPIGSRQVAYPQSHAVMRTDGATFPLWSISMQKLGISYDAWHLKFDRYFTDSGGSWTRSTDPIEADLSAGRHQILVHPIHWSRRDT